MVSKPLQSAVQLVETVENFFSAFGSLQSVLESVQLESLRGHFEDAQLQVKAQRELLAQLLSSLENESNEWKKQ
eukprot:1530741-Rhodomonas_salina.3